MSFGEYLGGVVGLAAVAVPLALAAVRLRRAAARLGGAPARLAEAVLGVSVLTMLLQLLGAFGLLGPAVLVVASVAVGVGVPGPWLRHRPAVRDAQRTGPRPRHRPSRLSSWPIALAAAAFVAAHWATGLQDVWARGMLTFDTLWYHGPFAARIAETGRSGGSTSPTRST